MFTVAVTVLAALLFGLMPAIAAFVSAPAPALRQSGAAEPRSRRLFGNGLVVAQVAISLALLSVSQLSIAHLRHLRDRSLGFDRNGVLLISINTSRAESAAARGTLPGHRSAPGGDSGRAGGCGERDDADCHGRSEPLPAGRRIRRTCAGQAAGIAEFGVSQLFRHLCNALLEGRDFRDADSKSRAASSSTRRWRGGISPVGIRLASTSGSRTNAIPTRSSASPAMRSIRTSSSRLRLPSISLLRCREDRPRFRTAGRQSDHR